MTAAQLTACMPRVPDAAVWATALTRAMDEHEITTPERQAAFLAQVAHESSDCRRLIENLNYSAARLMAVWPKRFPTSEVANRYGHLPERLANFVYANRMGNGDEASGDGWRFRGRGLIQLTGRSNYDALTRALHYEVDYLVQPDRLCEPADAARSAAWFWASRGCNALADCRPGDDDDADFVRISVIINGGRNGLTDRRAAWARTREALAA